MYRVEAEENKHRKKHIKKKMLTLWTLDVIKRDS